MKIAIAGFGVEGRASFDYWRDKGDVAIADEAVHLIEAPEGVPTILGKDAFRRLDGFDLVIRSAGVAPHKIKTDGKIWSATNEFFARCPAPIIGVTGTKGKGTTSSLIKSILEAAGRKVHLLGNIGQPALASLLEVNEGDVVVYELSSFQLWDLVRSPKVAVVLMIEPDHLDVHQDFEEYIAAKSNIVAYQDADDVVIYNQEDLNSAEIATQSIAATKLAYPVDISTLSDALQLPGQHNIDNASAAILAARSVMTIDDAAVRQGLAAFRGLDHRLKLVGEVGGVRYYDDSIATTPGSAVAAIKAFPDNTKVLILGGYDKGADFESIITACSETSTKVVAIGAVGEQIAEICQQKSVVFQLTNELMDEVVKVATELSQPGGVVLLSPAAASFDQYKNYQDRGDQFAEVVQKLK